MSRLCVQVWLNRRSKKDSSRRGEEFTPIGSQITEGETMERHEGKDFFLHNRRRKKSFRNGLKATEEI